MSGADSPTTEQLPKMSSDMQTEVAQRAGLKHVQTKEKNVLPTKEGEMICREMEQDSS